MKKVVAALLIILITGCTSMGMNSNMTSGRSDMRTGQNLSTGNSVIDNKGQLTLHHGG